MKRIAAIITLSLISTVAAYAAHPIVSASKGHAGAPHDHSPKMHSHMTFAHK